MNTNAIILKKCEKFIQEILEFFSENKETLDKAIAEDKAGRKQKGIIIERKNDKRELYTIKLNIDFSVKSLSFS